MRISDWSSDVCSSDLDYATAAAPAAAHVIVVGCEKGGSGKSTTSMHLTVALLRLGYRVGTVDLDARQWTLTRYLSNRAATVQGERMALPMPRHFFLAPSDKVNRAEAPDADRSRFAAIPCTLDRPSVVAGTRG